MTDWTLSVLTADFDDAGTDAQVRFRLQYQHFEDWTPDAAYQYGAIQLFGRGDSEKGDFTGADFSEEPPENFELSGIQLMHNNGGKKPGWAVEQIIIRQTIGGKLGRSPGWTNFKVTTTKDSWWIAKDEPGWIWIDPDGAGNKLVGREFQFKIGKTVVAPYV